MGIRRRPRVPDVGKCDRRVVHRADHISRERQHGVEPRGARGERLAKLVLLRPEYRLHAHQVRKLARPATRDRAAVEIHHDLKVSRVRHDVPVLLDPVRLVALPEVNLDAFDAPPAQLRELRTPRLACMHPVTRCLGDVVVRPSRVVPEQRRDLFCARMSEDIGDVAGLHLIPVRVDQRVLPSHLRRQIDERFQVGGVLRAVALRPPAPR